MRTGEKKRRRRRGRRGLTVLDNLCNKGHQPVLVPGNAFRQLTQGCQHFIGGTRADNLRHPIVRMIRQNGRGEGANIGVQKQGRGGGFEHAHQPLQ